MIHLIDYFVCNSDLLPYSSLRTDSIFHASGGSTTKTLNDYKLFFTEDSRKTDNKNLILKDNNFQSLSSMQ